MVAVAQLVELRIVIPAVGVQTPRPPHFLSLNTLSVWWEHDVGRIRADTKNL